MSDTPQNPAPDNETPGSPGIPGAGGASPAKGFDSGFITGEIRHQQLSARVPEGVVRGVFSTGVIVLTTQTEFVLDFLLRMARPHQIAARIVLPPAVLPSVINVLRDNIQKYSDRYGPIPQPPKPDNDRRPTLQEIYDDLKLPDELLSGVYANGMMVGHSHAEFCLDFLTNFFPRSSVSCRIYMAAAHIPRMVDSMSQTFNQYQQKMVAAQQAMRQVQPPRTPGETLPPPQPPENRPPEPPEGTTDSTNTPGSPS